MTVEDDCPICNPTSSGKKQFAVAMVAEHIMERARHDEEHQKWVGEHTENETLAEIREAL